MQLFFLFHKQTLDSKPASPKNTILEIKPITKSLLKKYLNSRSITIKTAKKYCKEVWYECSHKQYYALGLQNHKGGWELRNLYFKTSTSPKTYTYLNNHSDHLILLEGMFDLLSLAELFPDELINSDVIVLNSLSFLEPVSYLFKNYKVVDLYLDNDTAGIKYSKELIQDYKNLKDKSYLFEGYKDLNEKLISIRKKIKV